MVQTIGPLANSVHHIATSFNKSSSSHIAVIKNYDIYTYHHSLSVASLSLAIGIELKLDDRQLEHLVLCALLHDIGKTLIPLGVLNKSNPLTTDEFALVKSHVEKGSQYLKEHLHDEDILRGVLYHHEKYDGSGYPHGLRGKEIPLFSRIISVVDVYDALTSLRPYRKPVPFMAAANFIMYEMKNSFDSEIVKILPSIVHLK